MSSGLGRRSAAAAAFLAALLAALLVAIPASPAGAAESGPTITIDAPQSAPPRDSETVSVSGRATSTALGYSMKEVSLAVGGKTTTIACSGSDCPFSWSITLPLNGPYQLKVTATETAILLGDRSAEGLRSFSVAAPPARPTLDPPRVTDGRTVGLSWTRNTEPDMLYYAVFRKDPGATAFLQVGGRVSHPSAGSKVTFTDTTANNGGDYTYQVVAVRKGASGTADTEAKSAPSGSATATLAPAATTTTAAPPAGSPSAGPTTTAKPGPPAGVDLSGFLSSRSQPASLPSITVPEAPDGGFGNLPFGARPPGEELEEGEPDAVPPKSRSTSVFSRVGTGRPLVPVAGGLVLLLLAFHMRVLNRRIKPVADSDLPVDLDPPIDEQEPHPEPVPVVEPEVEPQVEPAAQFYDIAQEIDWAPVATELETGPPTPAEIGFLPTDDHDLDQNLDPDLDLDDDYDRDDEEIEVFEVVSPTRRRLARAGSR